MMIQIAYKDIQITSDLAFCGIIAFTFTLGYLLSKKVNTPSFSNVTTPTDQIVPAFGPNESAFGFTDLLHSPEANEIVPDSLEPLKILAERTDTIIFCKSYLYDRAFLPVEDINCLLRDLFSAINTWSSDQIYDVLVTLIPSMLCPEIIIGLLYETTQFSQMQISNLNNACLRKVSFRKEKINMLRLFGHLGTSANNLLFDFMDTRSRKIYDSFIATRQLEVLTDLKTTTMQRGNANVVYNLLNLLESPKNRGIS